MGTNNCKKSYAELEAELALYKKISRGIYELVNVNSIDEWNDSYVYEEGVDAVDALKTLVEATQDVTESWDYHSWCEWRLTFNPYDEDT